MSGEYKMGSLGDIIAKSCGVEKPEFDPKLANIFQNKKPLKRLNQPKNQKQKNQLAIPRPAEPKVKPEKAIRNRDAADIRVGARNKFQPSSQPDPIIPPSIRIKERSKVNKAQEAEATTATETSQKKQKKKLKRKKEAVSEKQEASLEVSLNSNGSTGESKVKKTKKVKAVVQESPLVETTKGSKVSKKRKKKEVEATEDEEEEDKVVLGSEVKKSNKAKKGETKSTGIKGTVEEQNRPKEKNPELESRTIYVGNVPKDANKKQLLKLFRQFGDIETLRLRCGAPDKPKRLKKVAINKKEMHPDRNSVAAYVRYKTREEAEEAMKTGNGMQLQDHHLIIDLADNSQKKDNKKAIFVGNLHLKCQDDELWSLFEDCGKVESVRIIRDRDTGMGKGFGYVNFQENSSVELALQKDGTELKNRQLRISRCVKKQKNKDEFGSSGGGGKGSKKARSQGRKQRGEVSEFSGDTTAEIGKFKRNSKKPNLMDVKKARVAKKLAVPRTIVQKFPTRNQNFQNNRPKFTPNAKKEMPKKVKKPRHVPRLGATNTNNAK